MKSSLVEKTGAVVANCPAHILNEECIGFVCGADGCAGAICGGNACGANVCGIQACPVDACPVDGCLIDVF